MNIKIFTERFNRELAMSGFPDDFSEKTKAVSKVFGVNAHLAHAMIFGHMCPSQEQLHRIAEILEAETERLTWKNENTNSQQNDTEKPSSTPATAAPATPAPAQEQNATQMPPVSDDDDDLPF